MTIIVIIQPNLRPSLPVFKCGHFSLFTRNSIFKPTWVSFDSEHFCSHTRLLMLCFSNNPQPPSNDSFSKNVLFHTITVIISKEGLKEIKQHRLNSLTFAFLEFSINYVPRVPLLRFPSPGVHGMGKKRDPGNAVFITSEEIAVRRD